MPTDRPSDEYLECMDELIADLGLPPPKNEQQRIAGLLSASGVTSLMVFKVLLRRPKPPSVADVCELFDMQWSDVLRRSAYSTWTQLEAADTDFQDWLSARKRREERERKDTYKPMTDHGRNPGLTRGKT